MPTLLLISYALLREETPPVLFAYRILSLVPYCYITILIYAMQSALGITYISLLSLGNLCLTYTRHALRDSVVALSLLVSFPHIYLEDRLNRLRVCRDSIYYIGHIGHLYSFHQSPKLRERSVLLVENWCYHKLRNAYLGF